MTLLGVFGILVGAMAWLVAFVHPTKLRVSVFALSYVLHVACTFFYYWGVQTSPADTAVYYYDPFYMYGEGLSVGTVFIVYLVQFIKTTFGGTYLDFFLIFQAAGFFGIAYLMRISEEIFAELDSPQPLYTYALLFLPGMHFWPSSIGKDSLFILAIAVALWAAMQFRRRYIALAVAALLMLTVRPHIALLAASAIAITVLMDSSIRFFYRLLLGLGAAIGAAASFLVLQSMIGLDLSNADNLTDVMASRDNLLQTEDAGNTRVDASFPLRVLSLLFRPLFFDTEGFTGYAASAENVLLLLVIGVIVFRFRSIMLLVRQIPFVRFTAIFCLLLIILLSWGYYNVGLGLRQKATMILPGILVIFFALTAFVEARRRTFVAQVRPG